MRGNLRLRQYPATRVRSIPACAGEPARRWSRPRSTGVYPRVCGGTRRCILLKTTGKGLSPRVRGNRAQASHVQPHRGSIPACAGEPGAWPPCRRAARVYPRVCGGTHSPMRAGSAGGGLSPRVRGNPPAPAGVGHADGSIPACAGEPFTISQPRCSRRVYPRVCGGTFASLPRIASMVGLSPRVRGNHRKRRAEQWRKGSIPACAGEPPASSAVPTRRWVYPRVCGGTHVRGTNRRRRKGLSPRVRGNLGGGPGEEAGVGSIPACAGEPRRQRQHGCDDGVYPRVCGGTRSRVLRGLSIEGLSPRVRGNPASASWVSPKSGSIPACAGEPKESK